MFCSIFKEWPHVCEATCSGRGDPVHSSAVTRIISIPVSLCTSCISLPFFYCTNRRVRIVVHGSGWRLVADTSVSRYWVDQVINSQLFKIECALRSYTVVH
jgi:hypothetical protein